MQDRLGRADVTLPDHEDQDKPRGSAHTPRTPGPRDRAFGQRIGKRRCAGQEKRAGQDDREEPACRPEVLRDDPDLEEEEHSESTDDEQERGIHGEHAREQREPNQRGQQPVRAQVELGEHPQALCIMQRETAPGGSDEVRIGGQSPDDQSQQPGHRAVAQTRWQAPDPAQHRSAGKGQGRGDGQLRPRQIRDESRRRFEVGRDGSPQIDCRTDDADGQGDPEGSRHSSAVAEYVNQCGTRNEGCRNRSGQVGKGRQHEQ